MMKPIKITYIGHATALFECEGTRIITDPHLGKRVLFFRRKAPLPFPPSELPELSCVLLSHSHKDHFNISSYKYISAGVPVIMPLGSERTVGKYLSNPVVELSHYSSYELADGTEITAVPSAHGRVGCCGALGGKINSYLVRFPNNGPTVFFCGDSAYGPHFAQIGNLGPIDLALLPIGSYSPRKLLKCCHMTPAEALQAFEDLKGGNMVPIHHGTFRLTWENIDEPLAWLNTILSARTDLAKKVHPLKVGEMTVVE